VDVCRLERPDEPLGLKVGQHIYLRASIGQEQVLRPYTPTSMVDERGGFELVIKVYRAHENPRYPDGGKMSQYLDR
jgi:nitrate reductase (NAD(P)H)